MANNMLDLLRHIGKRRVRIKPPSDDGPVGARNSESILASPAGR
jgi:hypothetical protein